MCSPTQATREVFADTLSEELGFDVVPTASVKEALEGVQAAYVATAARAPVVAASDVAALQMVAAVGATRPDHHELLGDVVSTASRVVVDCHDATEEPGDMIEAASRFGWEPAQATLLGTGLPRARLGRR